MQDSLFELFAFQRILRLDARENFRRENREILKTELELVVAQAVADAENAGIEEPDNITGISLFHNGPLLRQELLRLGQLDVYFFGGTPGIAEAAAEEGRRRWPGLRVVGCRNGYFQAEEEEGIVEAINASGAKMLFAFKYGMDIMNEMGIDIQVIRAGNANLFLSPIFRDALSRRTGLRIC